MVSRWRGRLADPTRPAKQVWEAVYGECWPEGWRVIWRGERTIRNLDLDNYLSGRCLPHLKLVELWFPGAMVDCYLDGLFHGQRWGEFFSRKPKDWQLGGILHTLLHEFTHMRYPRLRHGKRFNRLIDEARKRLVAVPAECQTPRLKRAA